MVKVLIISLLNVWVLFGCGAGTLPQPSLSPQTNVVNSFSGANAPNTPSVAPLTADTPSNYDLDISYDLSPTQTSSGSGFSSSTYPGNPTHLTFYYPIRLILNNVNLTSVEIDFQQGSSFFGDPNTTLTKCIYAPDSNQAGAYLLVGNGCQTKVSGQYASNTALVGYAVSTPLPAAMHVVLNGLVDSFDTIKLYMLYR